MLKYQTVILQSELYLVVQSHNPEIKFFFVVYVKSKFYTEVQVNKKEWMYEIRFLYTRHYKSFC